MATTKYGNTIANWNIVSPGILDTISRRGVPAAEANVVPASGLPGYFGAEEQEPQPPGILEHLLLGKFANIGYENKVAQFNRKKEKRQLDLALHGIDKMREGPAKDMLLANPMEWYKYNAKQEERSYDEEIAAANRANQMTDWTKQQEYKAQEATQAAAKEQALAQQQRDAYLTSMGVSGPAQQAADPLATAMITAFGPDVKLDADQQFRFKSALASPTAQKDVPEVVATINTENIVAQKTAQDAAAKTKEQAQQDAAAKETAARSAAEQFQQSDQFTKNTALKLSDDYTARTRGNRKVINSAEAVLALPSEGQTAAEQIATLYATIKALDADTGVKEGEIGLAQQTQSYMGLFDNYMARIDSGQILAPQAAKEMRALLTKLAESANQGIYRSRASVKSQAEKLGVSPDMVFGISEEDVDMSGYKPRFKEEGPVDTGEIE